MVEPPFGGMAFLPWSALLYNASLPRAMRGFQAALSPVFGAPAMPGVWHIAQTLSYAALPSMAPAFTATGLAPPAAAAAAVPPFLEAQAANSAGSIAMTTIGMKPCSLPHNSAHCPR